MSWGKRREGEIVTTNVHKEKELICNTGSISWTETGHKGFIQLKLLQTKMIKDENGTQAETSPRYFTESLQNQISL